MTRVTEQQATMAAIFAVADMGGKIYAPGVDVSNYGRVVQAAVMTDMKKAWAESAYVIERPFYGNNQHGWRLCAFTAGSGRADITPFFGTAREFADAMRTVSAMAGMRKVER